MINTIELRKQKATLVDEARGILDAAEAEKRELTDEEKVAYDGKMEEIRKLSEKIDREEELQKHELANAQRIEAAEKETKFGEFRSLAEFVATVRFNPNDPRLTLRQYDEEPLAQVGEDVQGGYLVPPRFLDEIKMVKPEDAVVRPRAQVIPAGYPPDTTVYIPVLNQSAHGMFAGVTVSWIEEGEKKPASKPKFDQIHLTPHEVAGIIHVTDKLLRNATAFEPLARNLLRGAVISAEEMAFLNGAVGGPTGLIGHASNILIPRAGVGAVAYADVIAMYSSMLMGGSYVWIANQTVLPQLMTMEDGADHLVWQPNAREGAPGTLLGLPCMITGKTPVLGTEGDLILADLRYYLIKDGSGIFLDASSHFRFTENITVIKITWNVDGRPWPDGTFLLEDEATEVSPFVVLSDVAPGP